MHDAGQEAAFGEMAAFRQAFYGCLTARADALFEASEAVLCSQGPVHTLAELSLTPEHRRGHGALYDAMNHGAIEGDRLREVLAAQPLPRSAEGRLVLGVDVSAWLRPDAATSPDRLFCHTYGRSSGQAQMIPGWPYSFVAAVEPGRTSWTAVLDAMRISPDDDVARVTAEQVRGLVERLLASGQLHPDDPNVLVIVDAGYDVTRLAFLLADLPVETLGRLRSDRVFRRPAPPRCYAPQGGRPPKHGGEFRFSDPHSWHPPQTTTTTDTDRYGTAHVTAWDRMHPRLTHRSAWLDHDGALPIVEGTLVRLEVEHLPGTR